MPHAKRVEREGSGYCSIALHFHFKLDKRLDFSCNCSIPSLNSGFVIRGWMHKQPHACTDQSSDAPLLTASGMNDDASDVPTLTARITRINRVGKRLAICPAIVLHSTSSDLHSGIAVDLVFDGDFALKPHSSAASATAGRGVELRLLLRCEYEREAKPNRRGQPALRCLKLLGLRSDAAAAAAAHQASDAAADATPKSERHVLVAAWLVAEYGLALLNSGTGVLDVAGGAGGLSEALLRAGVRRVTLIEPDPCGDRHARPEAEDRAPDAAGLRGNAESTRRKTRELEERLGRLGSFRHIARCFDAELGAHRAGAGGAAGEDDAEEAEVASLVRNCSFVVGLHPDQATDQIVRFAAAARKGFAVVRRDLSQLV